MKVGIVIVTYQAKKWLDISLASCFSYAPGVPVYVVDNASTDGTVDSIKQSYPLVKLIQSPVNLGFAAGNNLGLEQALQDGREAVLLLNQDAALTAGAIAKLVEVLQADISIGAVQAGLYLPNGLVNSLGNCFHYLGLAYAGGNGLNKIEADEQLPWLKKDLNIPYFSGAGVMLRTATLCQVGLLDEELFMYHEDLELSLRFLVSGWKIKVEPTARIIHHYQANRSLKQFYYMERNRWLVWFSYFKVPTLMILAVPWFFSEVLLLAMSFWQGWWRQKLKAYWYCLNRPAQEGIINRRRRLKKLKIISDRQILSQATSQIAFQGGNDFLTAYIFNPVSAAVWRVVYFLIRW
ncbi:glycosyltransferase family 2 protein [Patescibacteria group bacterium]|nr:glycosyltransferase family 2 protein [Patescibacteria group bacterium]